MTLEKVRDRPLLGPKHKGRTVPQARRFSQRQLKAMERSTRALQLRQAGLTFGEIAAQLGYAHESSASDAVRAALKLTISPVVEEYRQLNLNRLETILRGLWPHVLRGADHQLIGEARRVIHDINELLGVLNTAPTVEVSLAVSDEAKATVGVGITWKPDGDWMREFAKAYDEIHPGEYDSAKLLETLTDDGADGPQAPAGAGNGTAP